MDKNPATSPSVKLQFATVSLVYTTKADAPSDNDWLPLGTYKRLNGKERFIWLSVPDSQALIPVSSYSAIGFGVYNDQGDLLFVSPVQGTKPKPDDVLCLELAPGPSAIPRHFRSKGEILNEVTEPVQPVTTNDLGWFIIHSEDFDEEFHIFMESILSCDEADDLIAVKLRETESK